MGPGGGHGHAQPVKKFLEFSDCVGGADAGSGEDHGAFCICYSVEDFTRIRIQPRRIVGDRVLCWIIVPGIVPRGIVVAKRGGIDGSGLDVDRNIKPAGTRTSTLCEMPGALEVISDGKGVVDHHRVLSDLLDHGDDVSFLVSELAQARDALGAHAGFALDLPGNDEHRDGVGPSSEDSVERMDPAGPGGHVDHAGLAADAGVSFGGHRGSLFMVIANVLNARLLANGVVEVHGAAPGDEEDVAHTPIRELPDDVVRKLHERRTSEGNVVRTSDWRWGWESW